MRVLFCGINPGLYSTAVGYHFARPGNRFWRALHAAGFTGRLLAPSENRLLLEFGCGLTDIVPRPSAAASELSVEELIAGSRRLERKVRRYAPGFLAVLGLGAYRVAFGQPRATPGLQSERIGATRLWVLPNPSGLNAHYQLPRLARAFRALRLAASTPSKGRRLLPK